MSLKTLRNYLNIIFMLVAVIGVAYYLFGHKETGTYIILASMIIKFIFYQFYAFWSKTKMMEGIFDKNFFIP